MLVVHAWISKEKVLLTGFCYFCTQYVWTITRIRLNYTSSHFFCFKYIAFSNYHYGIPAIKLIDEGGCMLYTLTIWVKPKIVIYSENTCIFDIHNYIVWRALDGVPATVEVLAEIVDAVKASGKNVEVYMDGGIRKGLDVFRALAIGKLTGYSSSYHVFIIIMAKHVTRR